MRRLTASLVLSVLALGFTTATPSESSELGKGAIEISPSLAFSHSSYSSSGTTDLTTTTLDVSGLVGYFVSDLVELGGGPLASYQSVDLGGGFFGGSQSATSIGLIGGVGLNFVSSGNVVPFVRGSLGFLSNSGDVSGTKTTIIVPLLEGGLRVMVGNSASVNFAVGYQHQSNALGVQDESANIVTLGVGVSVFPVLRK